MTESAVARLSPTHEFEDTGLSTKQAGSTELAPTSAEAEAQYEIQGAIVLARRFPRNEDQAYGQLIRSCKRPLFADGASYSFPRGGSRVEGPSVKLAREAARLWGNIRYGLDILRDDDEARLIRGWAWDLETNTRVQAEDEFKKLIQRKGKGWVKPDERDLRELTNRRGAILVRNALLQLLPPDLIEEALTESKRTLENRAAEDPDGQRKAVVKAFGDLNVTAKMLEEYLGHPVSQCSPAEIADLKTVWASIRDGNSTWSEYLNGGSDGSGNGRRAEKEKGSLDPSEMTGKDIGPREEQPDVTAQAEAGDETASSKELEELRKRAQKKGVDDDGLDALCRLACEGRVLAELTHADVNTVVLELAKLEGKKA